MAAKIGGILLDLLAQTAKFQEDMRKATGTLAKFGEQSAKTWGLVRTAILSVAGFVGFRLLIRQFEDTAKSIEKIGRLSDRLGIPTEMMSALRFAAEQSGASFDELAKITSKLNRNLGEIAQGQGRDARVALQRLGVEALDGAGKVRPLMELLPLIAKGLEGIGSEAEQGAIAESLFGRGGAQIFLDVLKDAGSFTDNLAQATERARRLGNIYTHDQTQQIKEMNDAIERIGFAWEGLKAKVLIAVAPWIERMSDRLASFIAAIPKMLQVMAISLEQAFTPGPAGDQARKNWAEFWNSLWQLAEIGLTTVGQIAFKIAAATIDGILSMFTARTKIWFAHLPDLVALGFADAVNAAGRYISDTVATKFGIGKSGTNASEAWIASKRAAVESSMAIELAEAEALASQKMRLRNLDSLRMRGTAEMVGPAGRMGNAASGLLGGLGPELGAAAKRFGDASNAVLGWRDAMKATSMAAEDLAPAVAVLRKEIDGLAPVQRTEGAVAWDAFKAGWATAFKEIQRQARDVSKLGFDVLTNSVGAFVDSFSGELTRAIFAAQGFGDVMKNVMKSVGEAIVGTLLKMMALRIAMGVIGGIGAAIGPSSTASAAGASGGINFGSTTGTGWSGITAPTLHAKGTILDAPTLVAPGHVGGEAGPELLAPVTKMADGDYGVRMKGAVIEMHFHNYAGADVQSQERTGTDGRQIVDVYIRDAVGRMLASGEFDRTMTGLYGVRRQGVR